MMTAKKPDHPGGPVLRRPGAAAYTGLASTQFGELVAAGKFPQPIAIGNRTQVWLKSECDEWLAERARNRALEQAARKAARDTAPPKKAAAR
jgi:predicted DNA-binding transcriptional regulator AlpA